MSNEAANVAILREAYARWHDSKGASDDWMAMVADDIKFGSLAEGAPQLAFAKRYSSRLALEAYFAGLRAEWDMLHYTAHEFVAQGDMVFVRASTAWRHKRTGKSFDTPKADFWRFRDGKIVEFYEYYDTAKVLDAASL